MKRGINFKELVLRYSLLFLVGLLFIEIFYIIFRPLTIQPSFSFINLFFDSVLIGDVIIIKNSLNHFIIELVDACVAGSAYYLFLVLNLSTPNINIKKRLNMLGFSFLIFLILNLLRIFIFAILFVFGVKWFDFAHELTWYFVSVVFVVVIWFYQVKKFKIKEIPFYSDLEKIYKISTLNKKSKKI